MSSFVEPIRRVEPLAANWRSATWSGGSFDTAGRDFTPEVEGLIRTPEHMLLVTLSGSARRLEVEAECGHRFSGADRSGAVSFVPAGLTRRLRLWGVAATWGSISLSPTLFEDDEAARCFSPRAFSNATDPFIAAAIGSLARQLAEPSGLDRLYGEAVGLALVRHLIAADDRRATAPISKLMPLSRRLMERLDGYIEAHLDESLTISALASLAGLSAGYFHRAFKATAGMTPLTYIQLRRVDHAIGLLRKGDASIAQVALESGFASPSHFARTFRRVTGQNPSLYRSDDAHCERNSATCSTRR